MTAVTTRPATSSGTMTGEASQLSPIDARGVAILNTLGTVIRAKENGDSSGKVIRDILRVEAGRVGDPKQVSLVGYLYQNAGGETTEQMALLARLLPLCGITS